MTVVLVALICLLIALAIWYLSTLKLKWPPEKNMLPPLASEALPLVAHTFMFLNKRENMHDILYKKMLETSMRQGNEVVTVRLGFWNVYVIMNPDDAYLMCSKFLEKDIIYDFFKDCLGSGLLSAPVPTWKKHRKLLSPTFSQKVLEQFLIEFNSESRQLVKDIAHEVGTPFDHVPYVAHAALEQICSTAMGAVMDEKDRNIRLAYCKDLNIYADCVVERVLKFYYHSNFLYNFSILKRKKIALAKNLQKFAEEILLKRRATREHLKRNPVDTDSSTIRAQALLDQLLDLSDEGVMTDEEVRDEVNTFVAGGSDTTGYSSVMVLLNLGSYPEVQQKVFEEIEEVFHGSDRDVERQDLSKLKYMEAVIKETLRLYPAISGIGRIVEKELKLKDYVLPAGSRCFVSIYNIGRHPIWGPDAAQFRPERWLNPAELPPNHNAFSAFGVGRRNCIGGTYAMMAIKTMVVHVLREYRISGDITKLVLFLGIITRPFSGSNIRIEMRHPQTKT